MNIAKSSIHVLIGLKLKTIISLSKIKISKRIGTKVLNDQQVIILEHPFCVIQETDLLFHLRQLLVHHLLIIQGLFLVRVFFNFDKNYLMPFCSACYRCEKTLLILQLHVGIA